VKSYKTLVALVVLLISPAFAQSQRRDNPTLKEMLHWMQTTLESGAGDYSVGHEVRSVRLEDFVGCNVHFSYSTRQEPYANNEPAPEPKKPYHVDYLFSLGDTDPTDITFSKGSGLHAGDDGLYESPSFLTIRTRNDKKKITIRLPGQPEADSRPDNTSLIFSLDSIDNDYVVRFAEAFNHAVYACGGKPSLFADSYGQGSNEQAPFASADAAAQSVSPAPTGTTVVRAARPTIPPFDPKTPHQSAPPRKDIPAIAKAANGAVVSIIMSDKDGNPIALGTGFLISTDGRIVTNYHVIASGSSAIVKLPDGAVFPVEGVLAADKDRDVALIKARRDNFRTLTLGNSDGVQVGQEVVAIGNPLSLESTVSNGIVSGMRSVKEEGGDFLQITAPISPGSSGGPLFNMDGQVIGITTMHLKGGENLNFAIPINDVKRLIFTDSLELHKLPNEPESASEEASSSTAGEAPNAQVNSPAFQSYLELLKSGDRTLKDGTYACFDDDPESSNTFMVITADLSQGKYMQVMTENFGNGVSTGAGKAFYGQLSSYSGGKQGLLATLPTMNPSDQGDVFEWGPDVLTMRHVIGTRSSDEFNVQRSTGRYTEQIVLGNDPSSPPSTIERAGRCIRIPNARQTPEEEYDSRK